jgi:hypothetical protein
MPRMIQLSARWARSPRQAEERAVKVGRNQVEFIRVYRERVIPKLDWPEKG